MSCKLTPIGWCVGHGLWCERVSDGWVCPLAGRATEDEVEHLRAEVARLEAENRRLRFELTWIARFATPNDGMCRASLVMLLDSLQNKARAALEGDGND